MHVISADWRRNACAWLCARSRAVLCNNLLEHCRLKARRRIIHYVHVFGPSFSRKPSRSTAGFIRAGGGKSSHWARPKREGNLQKMPEPEQTMSHRFRRGSMFQEPLESEVRQFRGHEALKFIYCGSNSVRLQFKPRKKSLTYCYCVRGNKTYR
jgi:hypothetical protein